MWLARTRESDDSPQLPLRFSITLEPENRRAPRGDSIVTSDSPEFHCCYSLDRDSAERKGRIILQKFGPFLKGPVTDLACGEGATLLALAAEGRSDLIGVELNDRLATLAKSSGVTIVKQDLLEYLASRNPGTGTYLYIDVIEHLPFDYNSRLFASIPIGSRLIIQTPYTDSLLGHQFYLNVPSHVAPYSPWVIRQMLSRTGYDIVSEGSVDGKHPNTWVSRLRAVFVRRVLGLPTEMILGGGNFYIVADHVREFDPRD
jgi:hypothetical protein